MSTVRSIEVVTERVRNFDCVAVHEYDRRLFDSVVIEDETVF